MNRTIEDIQKDIELLGIKGGYDIEQLLTPQDCRRLSYEIERLNNIINGMEKFFKYAYDNEVRPLNDRKVSVWTICLDKLQELKGSDKE